jgi:uncharacterized membrane protein
MPKFDRGYCGGVTIIFSEALKMNDKRQSSPNNLADESCGRACSSTGMNISSAERAISWGVGGALLLFGLARMRTDALLIMLGGGALVYRGLTGHCYGYEALGISTAEPEEAESPPTRSVEKSEKAAV